MIEKRDIALLNYYITGDIKQEYTTSPAKREVFKQTEV